MFLPVFNRRRSIALACGLAAFALCGTLPASARAQEDTEEDYKAALNEAAGKLEGLLNELEAFSKTMTDSNGNKFFNVIWEADGETTKMTLQLRQTGHWQGKIVFALYAWAGVAGVSEGTLPPAVIKLVASENDLTLLGFYSCNDKFTEVFANSTCMLTNMNAGDLWMTLAYLHINRVEMKKKIDAAVGG